MRVENNTELKLDRVMVLLRAMRDKKEKLVVSQLRARLRKSLKASQELC